jgi:hypothetical protein
MKPVTTDMMLTIYDFFSFTSELTELKYFVAELATFCEDTRIRIIDTHEGIIEQNLCDFLQSYNDGVNIRATFDVTRIFDVLDGPAIMMHQKSGMLGVYGNIVLSTFLHGLFLTFMTGSHDQACVVGDDAGGLFQMREWSLSDVIKTLSTIGIIHPDKSESWIGEQDVSSTHGWQFLKRPLDRIGNSIYTGILLDLPLAHYAATVDNDFHTADAGSLHERVRAIVMQSCRLLDRMHIYESRLDEDSIAFALGYLQDLFVHLQLPTRGALPPIYHPSLKEPIRLVMPVLDRRSVARPWLHVVKEELVGTSFTVPRFGWSAVDPEPWRFDGQEFEATSTPLLTLAVDLGIMSQVMEATFLVLDRDTQLILDALVAGDLRTVYSYKYLCEPPSWWRCAFYETLCPASAVR